MPTLEDAQDDTDLKLKRLGRSSVLFGFKLLGISLFLLVFAGMRIWLAQATIIPEPDWTHASVIHTQWFRYRTADEKAVIEPTSRRAEPARYGSSTEFVQAAIRGEARGVLLVLATPLMVDGAAIGEARRVSLNVHDAIDEAMWFERTNAVIDAMRGLKVRRDACHDYHRLPGRAQRSGRTLSVNNPGSEAARTARPYRSH